MDVIRQQIIGSLAVNTTGYVYKFIDSPVGKLKLIASDKGLAAVLWEKDDPRRVRLGTLKPGSNNKFIKQAENQLKAYFSGKLKKFTVPLDFKGTDFQKSVWTALLTIPFGETRSYGEIARQIGRPHASRAIGAANGRNPISIITPCHRVLGTNGKLTGFAGGLEAKDQLLKHEGGDPRLGLAGRGVRREENPVAMGDAVAAQRRAALRRSTDIGTRRRKAFRCWPLLAVANIRNAASGP
jgi:methylated-DNA-[protein]-cysteine S-methyltransferase